MEIKRKGVAIEIYIYKGIGLKVGIKLYCNSSCPGMIGTFFELSYSWLYLTTKNTGKGKMTTLDDDNPK